jgi:hypothetical protein
MLGFLLNEQLRRCREKYSATLEPTAIYYLLNLIHRRTDSTPISLRERRLTRIGNKVDLREAPSLHHTMAEVDGVPDKNKQVRTGNAGQRDKETGL